MNTKINVLITSISRKVWLVKSFKDALKQAGNNGKVISVDSNPLSAGLYFSDKYYLVANSKEQIFIPEILNICKRESIKLLIPTRDGELLLFAKNKNKFVEQGVQVMVSNPEVIEICNDKYKFYLFLKKNNIPTPKTLLPDQINSSLNYPLLVKSKYGSGSKGIFEAKNKRELEFFNGYIDNPIIQEFLDGKEYTIDLLSDFNGKVITIVPRERIETFSGESYKGKTIKDDKAVEYAKNLAEKLGTIGHITIQFIKSIDGIKFIEVNPRFGGGANCSIKAGANTPLYLIKMLKGENIKPRIGKFKDGYIMLRYTSDIFINEREKN